MPVVKKRLGRFSPDVQALAYGIIASGDELHLDDFEGPGVVIMTAARFAALKGDAAAAEVDRVRRFLAS